MTTIRFRLVKAGDPEEPVRVFPVWEKDGVVVFSEGNFSQQLPGVRLDDLREENLPEWLRNQGLGLSILPVRTASGRTMTDAMLRMYESASSVYHESEAAVRQAAA